MIYILFWTTKTHFKKHLATTLKVEENSRSFQGLLQKCKDFSRKNGIVNSRTFQGLPLNSRTFQDYANTVDCKKNKMH